MEYKIFFHLYKIGGLYYHAIDRQILVFSCSCEVRTSYMKFQQVRMILSGRVQGVGFRHSMVRQALKLGITGWVRNLPDGRLEALLQGRTADLGAMIQWCSKGPPLAVVRNTEVSWDLVMADERIQSFEIRF